MNRRGFISVFKVGISGNRPAQSRPKATSLSNKVRFALVASLKGRDESVGEQESGGLEGRPLGFQTQLF